MKSCPSLPSASTSNLTPTDGPSHKLVTGKPQVARPKAETKNSLKMMQSSLRLC